MLTSTTHGPTALTGGTSGPEAGQPALVVCACATTVLLGTTPRVIRHHHAAGLLPEPERGSGDHRRYGSEDMTRLLWIRRTADAGIALEDIRNAFDGTADDGADSEQDFAVVLARLETTLLAQEAELPRQRTAVRRRRGGVVGGGRGGQGRVMSST